MLRTDRIDTPTQPQPQDDSEQIKRKLQFLRRVIYSSISIILLSMIGWFIIHRYHYFSDSKGLKTADPLPSKIRNSVGFGLYYPSTSVLPSGYTLNTRSFSSNKIAVVYTVNMPSGKLVFSQQQKPSTMTLQTFVAKYLPLHLTMVTSLGTADMGVIGSQTVISLPTNGNTWILITGPLNTNQAQLSRVLQSLQIAH